MKKLHYILAAALMALCAACGEVEDPLVTELKTFLTQQSVPGIYQNGRAMFAYNESAHQICTNTVSQMCRIQLDDASVALTMTLSSAPEVGKKQTLTLGLHNIKLPFETSYEVEVSEVDSEKHLVRLFERETLMGFVFCYE